MHLFRLRASAPTEFIDIRRGTPRRRSRYSPTVAHHYHRPSSSKYADAFSRRVPIPFPARCICATYSRWLTTQDFRRDILSHYLAFDIENMPRSSPRAPSYTKYCLCTFFLDADAIIVESLRAGWDLVAAYVRAKQPSSHVAFITIFFSLFRGDFT